MTKRKWLFAVILLGIGLCLCSARSTQAKPKPDHISEVRFTPPNRMVAMSEADIFSLRADGSARWYLANGYGVRYGTFAPVRFQQLARLIRKNRFFSLRSYPQHTYGWTRYDPYSTLISVIRNGRTKNVEHGDGRVPWRLRTVELEARAIAKQITWRDQNGKTRAGQFGIEFKDR